MTNNFSEQSFLNMCHYYSQELKELDNGIISLTKTERLKLFRKKILYYNYTLKMHKPTAKTKHILGLIG